MAERLSRTRSDADAKKRTSSFVIVEEDLDDEGDEILTGSRASMGRTISREDIRPPEVIGGTLSVILKKGNYDPKPVRLPFPYSPEQKLKDIVLHCAGSLGMKKMNKSRVKFYYKGQLLDFEVPDAYRVNISESEDVTTTDELSICKHTSFVQYFDKLVKTQPDTNVKMEGDSVVVNDEFTLSMKSTLRLPEDKDSPMPLPLRTVTYNRVSHYSSKVPPSWVQQNTMDNAIFAGVYQSEAIWINFEGDRPYRVRVHATNVIPGKADINVVTGESSSAHKSQDLDDQDYIVCPPEYWLTGVPTETNTLQQLLPPKLTKSNQADMDRETTDAPKIQLEITPLFNIDFTVLRPPQKFLVGNSKEEEQTVVRRWSIRAQRKQEYENQFRSAGKTHGFLDGATVRELLLPSGLSSVDLAKIWSLASLRKTKSLDLVEFSIAKFLVEYKAAGNELPDVLPFGLVPVGYPVHPVVRKQMEEAIKDGTDEKKVDKKAMWRTSKVSLEQLGWEEASIAEMFRTPAQLNMREGDVVFFVSAMLPKRRDATLSDYNIGANSEIVLMTDESDILSLSSMPSLDSVNTFGSISSNNNRLSKKLADTKRTSTTSQESLPSLPSDTSGTSSPSGSNRSSWVDGTIQPKFPIFINVKDSGRVYTVNVQSSNSVAYLKSLVRKVSNIPEDLQRILIVGVEMEDSETLSFYHIGAHASLGLIVSDVVTEMFEGLPEEKLPKLVSQSADTTHLGIFMTPMYTRPRRMSTKRAMVQFRGRSDDVYDLAITHANLFETLGKKVPPVLMDEYGANAWDNRRSVVITLYLINSKMYKRIVGQFIPRAPIDKARYELENIEWSPECEEQEWELENEMISNPQKEVLQMQQTSLKKSKSKFIDLSDLEADIDMPENPEEPKPKKPRKYLLKQVPPVIQGRNGECPLESSELLPQGFVVSTYANTNTVVVTHIQDSAHFVVDYPTTSTDGGKWACDFPYLHSLEDNFLFVYDIEKKKQHCYTFKFSSLKEAYAPDDQDESDLFHLSEMQTLCHCALFSRSSVFLLLHLNVVDFGTFNCLLVWRKSQTQSSPEIVKLKSDHALVPNPMLCHLKSDKSSILLCDGRSFQIWNYRTKSKLYDSQERSSGKDKSAFQRTEWVGNNVVTWSPVHLSIWNLESTEGQINVDIEKQILTDLFVDLQYIITEDLSGLLTVRSVQNGRKLHNLNRVQDLKMEPEGLVELQQRLASQYSLSLVQKPNRRISRHGKWVFAGGKETFNAYDITQENTKVPAHAYFAECPVKQLLIDLEQSTIYMGVVPQRSSQLQVVVWSPNWDGFGAMDMEKRWRYQVAILKQEKKSLLSEVEKLKKYVSSLELEKNQLLIENEQLHRELGKTRGLFRKKNSSKDLLLTRSVSEKVTGMKKFK